jgi:hypothetical protein
MKGLLRIRQMLVILLFVAAADMLAREASPIEPVPVPRVRPPDYVFEYWSNHLVTPPQPQNQYWPRSFERAWPHFEPERESRRIT